MIQWKKTAIIIGAGPAGLTAAYEFLHKSDIHPIIFEMDEIVGGIARTINYKGNRIDIGGHRFFSKSDRVIEWWSHILPIQEISEAAQVSYQGKKREISSSQGPNPDSTDRVMLVRKRGSSIYFLGKFFDYPLSFNFKTLALLGPYRSLKIILSYLKSSVIKIRPEKNLEEFFINRFGNELYQTFFKDYTEKLWGVPCNKISAEWGAQRVKSLSLGKTLISFVQKKFQRKKGDISQKSTETSLIEYFLYPKHGPGQMWEETTKIVREKGGEIFLGQRMTRLFPAGKKIAQVEVEERKTGNKKIISGDYFFSTMPVKELILALGNSVPEEVKNVAKNLQYRDFITVGLLLKNFSPRESRKEITETWIYIQEPNVKMTRLQIFNHWSPYMVKDKNTVWVGAEFVCNEGDNLWEMRDEDIVSLARRELCGIGLIEEKDFLDAIVIRMPKAYPAYFGSYAQFDIVKKFIDTFENLFLVGRNGMHKYNNQDHSMLTAMQAVENIINGVNSKQNIWEINTEEEYHEEKK